MDETNLPEGASTSGYTAQSKKSVERALTSAALRELRARKREQYAAEDAEDAAKMAALHKERLAQDDAAAAENWQMNADREFARAEGRAEWVEQHAEAAEMRREARAAQRQYRADNAAAEKASVEEIRARRNAANDGFTTATTQINVAREMGIAEGRAAWAEAQGRAIDARRAYKAAMKELRQSQAADRPARLAAEKAARKARIAARDAEDEQLRTAAKEHCFAIVQLREAERAGESQERLEALRAREAELKEYEARLQVEVREARLAAEDVYSREISEEGKRQVMEEALLREEWLFNRELAAEEKRKAKVEERAVRRAARETERAQVAALREERNASVAAAQEGQRELFTNREMHVAELQESYLDALQAEHAELRRVRAEEREAAPAIKEREKAEAARRRQEKIAREEAESAACMEIAKERAYARSLERDAAIASSRVAYKAMCGDMDSQGLK